MALHRIRNLGLALLVALAASSCFASSSATLLLEEPYGKLGFFTGTGHAAVYLSGVCADTPVHLRTCHPGETGVVISRYDGVGKYDWVAIPLIPYLYAVENPDDVPLFADAKMVAFLRDHYRRKHLEAIAPDVHDGEVPGGNWYELVGTSYDRTVYGFEIATTPEKDKALIEKLNASPNRSHFRTVSSNCADFAKGIINFYYPKALHRSVIADVGITTPKQMAKMLTKFSARHPEIDSSRLVIGQVPGSMPRSTTAHGVVESFFKSKKYIVPSAVVSPIFAGCVAAVYVGTGAGRFEPARDAMVYVVNGEPERPLDAEDRRAYREELKHLASASPKPLTDHSWGKLQSRATATVDASGRPVLEFATEEGYVRIGVSASNLFEGGAPPQMIRELLEARLHSELNHRPAVTLTETEVARDWKLLQQATEETEPHFTRTALHTEMLRANAP
jgi:hypothetical protein